MEVTNYMNDNRPLVLVAEDDESNFKLIKAIIQKKYRIEWAKNGEEMIDLFRKNKDEVSLLLMDIKMPIMNGLDATKAIRQLSTDIPIIMQTAYAFNSDREAALQSGANEVLVKPITLSTLRGCLSRYTPEITW